MVRPAEHPHAPPPTGRLARAREQLALAGVFALLAARYWLSIYPQVTAHLRRTRRRARAICDPTLRGLALASLEKRSNLEGAAAFAALVPRATRKNALRALLSFQSIYNYADVLAEQPAAGTLAAARHAHLPLALALGAPATPAILGPTGPCTADAEYLGELLACAQQAIDALPSAALARERMLQSARDIAEFQAHSRPSAAPDELQGWASALPPRAPQMSWSETAAACGSSLTVHALIAAAGTPRLDEATVERLNHAYGGPIGALHSMLDSLIDQDEDSLSGQPSLIALYPGTRQATQAMGDMAEDAMRAARSLPQGRRHAVLLAAMAGLYLSDPRAHTSHAAPIAAAVRARIGLLLGPAMAVFAIQRRTSRHITPRRKRPTNALLADCGEPERPARACARTG